MSTKSSSKSPSKNPASKPAVKYYKIGPGGGKVRTTKKEINKATKKGK